MSAPAQQRNRCFWPDTSSHRWILFLAVALAALLRSIRLMDLFPILVDEAIYIRWAEIIQHRHQWFISLLDGKPPLGYWVYAAMRLPFHNDPLLAARLISVAAGVLAVLLLYQVGCLCAGPVAGLVTALLYAVLPYGVFYDRIAYLDSLVNLFGIALAYVSLLCFGDGRLFWKRTAALGLTLGLGLFTKTTVLLLAFVPVVTGLHFWRGSRCRLALHLTAAFALAAAFVAISWSCVPRGPTFDSSSVLFHRTDFFTPLAELARDPLIDIRVNGPLLAGYAARYVTVPSLVIALFFGASLWRSGIWVPVWILIASVLPFAVAVATLEYFPSRYLFPQVWPILLVIGCGATIPFLTRARRLARGALVAAATAAMLLQSTAILTRPEKALHETDAEEFLSSNPYSGSGVAEAIDFLRTQARSEPITILTDPWWGPPTDAVFAYLNQVRGTQVFEAWWLQLDGEYKLVPSGAMPVWKSQYERVADGEVDFSATRRLYYVTDTNYNTLGEVRSEAPQARLLHRFPKRGGAEFIDVYRLQ